MRAATDPGARFSNMAISWRGSLSAGPFRVGSPPHPALSPTGSEGLQASLLVRERDLLDELHLDLTADGARERHGIECAAP